MAGQGNPSKTVLSRSCFSKTKRFIYTGLLDGGLWTRIKLDYGNFNPTRVGYAGGIKLVLSVRSSHSASTTKG